MWEKVCKSADLPPGGAVKYEKDSHKIGVYHTEEGLFAIHNICPHFQTELHEGQVKDGMVYCPWHSWPIQLKTGECALHQKFNIASFPVKEEDQFIWVDTSKPATVGK